MKFFTLLFLVCLFTSISTINNKAFAYNYDEGTPDSLVIPLGYANTPGTSTFLSPLSTTARTYQMLIHASQLTEFVNKSLLGIAFRLPTNATSSWPVVDVEILNYDVYLSGSVNPSERSLVFIENVVGTQELVRTGRYDIPTGSYPSGGSPNNFGTEITFDGAYVYTGGNLLIEIRHSGFSNTASRSNDALSTSTSGYGTLFSACWQTGYTATNGLQGNFSIVRIKGDDLVGIIGETEIPSEYKLHQNYPNPFNPSTTISFSIPEKEFVTLNVYNSLGQVVSTLVSSELLPGNYDFSFDASNLTSGVYFYEIRAGEFVNSKRMMLLK